MIDLHPVDVTILVAYFVGITVFGALVGRSVRSTREFFLAGQRFPAWLVGFSCVATLVGSYSFVKYASRGYVHGLSSSQTYFNDWFWMPLWMFGWLPIFYFGGILSVPEYFARRFGPRTRAAATLVLLLYLVGYIGINLYTIGVALETLLRGSIGLDAFTLAAIVAAMCMAYEFTGGQTSVILTDLVQGALLLLMGIVVFALGLAHLGGFEAFWSLLPAGHGQPLPPFNQDPSWNFVGIFWQDGMAGGVAFYFMNQAMLMRFLSARSVSTARRAAGLVLLVLMPLAALSVSGAGWLGAAMTEHGSLPAETAPQDVFLVVTDLLCGPGVFGLVVAALLAALMSTADTLINASSAVLINDVYRPLFPGRADRHYLRAARGASLLVAVIGLLLVPLFASFQSIYEAHGAFTAAITPPLTVAILLAFLWPRCTPAGALATLLGGTALMFASVAWPALVTPFAHGVPDDGGYKYIRACYGMAVSLLLGVGVSLVTRPRDAAAIAGLTIWTCRHRTSGSAAALGSTVKLRTTIASSPGEDLLLPAEVMQRLGVDRGDTVFVDDARWWLGGMRSLRATVVNSDADQVRVPAATMADNRWREGQRVVLQRID